MKGLYIAAVVVGAFLLWNVAPKITAGIVGLILLVTLINAYPKIESAMKGG